ncbi:DEBC related cluster [Shigella sonnei]|nr:DEBC related cluster [Shigella sonnei]
MNRIEHYHDWLRDAHAMEKQAEPPRVSWRVFYL